MSARFLVVALLFATASQAVAQDPQDVLSDFDVTASEVVFHLGPTYSSVALVVAGPGAFRFEQIFDTDTARFSLAEHGALADGSYKFEFRGRQALPADLVGELTRAREAGDGLLVAAILADAGMSPDRAVTSMRLGIRDGQFLEPEEEVLDTPTDAPSTGGLRRVSNWNVENTSGPWQQADFQLNGPDGEVYRYTGFVKQPDSAADGTNYMRAYIKPTTNPGHWTRGYFTTEDGALRFIDQTTFDAEGLTSAIGRPFDYLTEAQPAHAAPSQLRDQVIGDDLIVTGSICAGFDCVNGEGFGFDTIRLKENNLRIKFQDTSTSASFPTRDWQITANESSNGGANKFSIEDIDGSRIPFTLEAGAPSHSLYVDDGGRLGFGTSTPVVELHVKDGDSPTLRLEQDGTHGFTAQTWDVVGNEANFFIRDVTNGSKLPFQIKPGAASASIFVEADGDIGFGTSGPTGGFHIVNGTGASDDFIVTNEGRIQIADGTASEPAITFNDDTDTGFFRKASGDIKMTLNGVETDIGSGGGFAGTFDDGTAGTPGIRYTNDTDTGFFRSSSNTISVSTGGTERASFNGSGDFTVDTNTLFLNATSNRVGMGTTNPQRVLHVVGTGDIARMEGSSGFIEVDGAGTRITGSAGIQFRGQAVGSSQVVITTAGNVGIGLTGPGSILQVVQNSSSDPLADAWLQYSSRRWKTDVLTLDDALDTVQRLRGVSYTWKADGRQDIGLIAEEVGQVIPEIVVFEENGVDAQSVDYARLVAVLIEAVKEQQHLIQSQDATILSLNSRVDNLELNIQRIIQGLDQSAKATAPPKG